MAPSATALGAGADERFEWDAPLGCPDGQHVLAAVSELASARPLDLGTYRKVRGRVEQVAGQWQLLLELEGPSRRASRQLSAPSCEDLVRAAALALALAIESEATLEAAEPAGDPEPAAPPPAEAEPPTAPQSGASASPSLRMGSVADDPSREPENGVTPSAMRVMAGAAAALDSAALPDPAPGVSVWLGLGDESWRAGAYALWLPAQSAAAGVGGEVQFSLLAAGLAGCHELLRFWASLGGCIGTELGRLEARGVGLQQAASFGDGWLASHASLELRGELGERWFWQATGAMVIPWLRQRYFVDQTRPVHRAGLPGSRWALGVGVEF